MRYFLVESKIQYQNYLYLHTSKNNAVHVAVHYPDQVKWICLCPANNAKLCFLSVFFSPPLVCFIGAAVSGPWCHVWEEGETSGTCDWSRGRWRQLLCYWVVSLWKVKHVSFQLLRNSREYLLQDSFWRKHAFCNCCLFLLSFHVPL